MSGKEQQLQEIGTVLEHFFNFHRSQEDADMANSQKTTSHAKDFKCSSALLLSQYLSGLSSRVVARLTAV